MDCCAVSVSQYQLLWLADVPCQWWHWFVWLLCPQIIQHQDTMSPHHTSSCLTFHLCVNENPCVPSLPGETKGNYNKIPSRTVYSVFMGNLSVLMVENIQNMIRPQYQYNVVSRMARERGGIVINKLITLLTPYRTLRQHYNYNMEHIIWPPVTIKQKNLVLVFPPNLEIMLPPLKIDDSVYLTKGENNWWIHICPLCLFITGISWK